MNKATLAVLAALIMIFTGVAVAILFARGYQLDITTKTVQPTGILVATSDPDGAEVIIDGKLRTATNNTINLAPGKYKVQIQKEGYASWEKEVEIKKEEVFKTNAFLFPSLSDLRPLTFTGAINPTISPDNTKIVYGIASASARLNGLSSNGVWILDTGRNLPAPIPGSGEFRQIFRNTTTLSLSNSKFQWSPDSKQILVDNTYLLDTDRINESPTLVSDRLVLILDEWKNLTSARQNAQLAKLPTDLRATLATASTNLVFSPDETKILYTATASASLPIYLSTYLPGTNPTPENRNLKPGNFYVYDLKEDRNYLVEKSAWFPSSRHLLTINNDQIRIMEYDGTNPAVLFNGQFDPKSVFAWPNWSKIVILTNLGSTDPKAQNLYTVNLR